MTRAGPIPYGPERKDPSWRWGSFLIGVASFAVLAWIATLGDIDLLGWWWLVTIVLGVLFSLRSGRAWAAGDVAEIRQSRALPPTVEVTGQPGSTYVLLEAGKGKGGARVKPREFGPFWWALYSLAVRAPVALGDFVLTSAWRASGGFWNGGSASRGQLEELDQVDHAEELPQPDRQRF